MRRSIGIGAALLLGVLAAGQVRAVDGNEALDYRGGAKGRVIFDGRTHAAKGLACNACHSALFATRRTGLITMGDHGTGAKCFACHDGTQAFNACTACHRSPGN
jgi:c(7)-type cytochrome triheme protein